MADEWKPSACILCSINCGIKVNWKAERSPASGATRRSGPQLETDRRPRIVSNVS